MPTEVVTLRAYHAAKLAHHREREQFARAAHERGNAYAALDEQSHRELGDLHKVLLAQCPAETKEATSNG